MGCSHISLQRGAAWWTYSWRWTGFCALRYCYIFFLASCTYTARIHLRWRIQLSPFPVFAPKIDFSNVPIRNHLLCKSDNSCNSLCFSFITVCHLGMWWPSWPRQSILCYILVLKSVFFFNIFMLCDEIDHFETWNFYWLQGWVVLSDKVGAIEMARVFATQIRWEARVIDLENGSDQRLLVCQKPFVKKWSFYSRRSHHCGNVQFSFSFCSGNLSHLSRIPFLVNEMHCNDLI